MKSNRNGSKPKRESNVAIIVVTPGTTMSEGKTVISLCMDLIKKQYPKSTVRFSFTSEIVRNVLLESGDVIRSPVAEVAELTDAGYSRIVFQPMSITSGIWYRDLYRLAVSMNTLKGPHYMFGLKGVIVSRPLLQIEKDHWETAKAICTIYKEHLAHSVVVLVAPESEGDGNEVLCEFQMILDEISDGRIIVGSMTGFPGIAHVIKRLRQTGERDVILVPLTLIPGISSWIEIAGDNNPDSCKKMLENEGFRVTADTCGLGEYSEIIDLFTDKIVETVQKHRFF